MTRRTILAALALALLAGCTIHPARDGILVQKYQVAPWVETWVELRCIVHSSQGACTAWMPIHHRYDHPHSWWVRIHGDKAIRQGKESGRGVYADWPVHRDLWEQVEPGQHLHISHADEAPH
jgi:hypothetical protein